MVGGGHGYIGMYRHNIILLTFVGNFHFIPPIPPFLGLFIYLFKNIKKKEESRTKE
jgi:hypothetical protein